ncbi:hypothetical protein VE01_03116 [Pseudogymnoascus verrucosus]|uniref:Uncharacterized protein n=1 Tax=Pseudogymnoascus verrucosus TaxID=342668 RepID=A0A1B8GR05_9PEZI|nr:uncharacterized protein VE01_03116 [Pseudogymnoascus verrucosus]OBT98263.1 hypothetical protein VE01_03116 [Pseudogymnoascus verrucosus]
MATSAPSIPLTNIGKNDEETQVPTEVQRGITNAGGPVNPGDRERWVEAARTKVYDACYNGCDASPSCASEACAKTAALNVTGVVCDANLLWDQRDRHKKLEKARQNLAIQPQRIPCYRPPPPLPTTSGTRTGNTTTPLQKKVSPPPKAPKKMAPRSPSLDQLSLETLVNDAATPTPATTPSSASTLSTSTEPPLV